MATLSNSETLYVNVVRPTPEGVGTLLASETAFASRLEWSRMSDDKGSLVVILLDNGGTVSTAPRRITLPAGRSLYLYAKADTSDTAQTVVAGPFTASGSSATDYAFTATLDLAVDSALWPDNGILNLSVAFVVEDTADGANPSSYPAELVLRRNPLGEGTPSNTTVFLRKALNLSDLASAPTALTNLGGTTIGKAVFTAVDAAAARTAIGAGTGNGDLIDAGTITLANVGKLPVITALKTLGVGPSYSDAAGASTVVQRTSNGRIIGGMPEAVQARLGASSGGTESSYPLAIVESLSEVLMGGFRALGTTSTDLEVVAYKAVAAEFKSALTAGATLKTANGSTVMTFGVSNSTDVTFAGAITAGSFAGSVCEIEDGQFTNVTATGDVVTPIIKATTSGGGVIQSANGTECASWGAGNGANFTVVALSVTGNAGFAGITEGVVAIGNSGTSKTLAITAGTTQTCTLTGNCTFTMPAATAGKSFTLFLNTGAGSYTATFTGVKWSGGTAPTITTTASRLDILAFTADGTNWYGSAVQNFTP